MKRLTFWRFLPALLCIHMQAQTIEPRVSEPVELMSILARTADFQEYHMDLGGSYIHDIDSCFTLWSEHPAVSFMKEARRKYGIAYDAVMSMAVHLQQGQEGFSLIPEEKNTLESRWNNVDQTKFLHLLSDFYRKTRFHDFFQAHRPLYERGLKAYRDSVLSKFDATWYASFYGKAPQETFSVIIGFCNGGGNYGTLLKRIGKPTEVFAVVGHNVDKHDHPLYNRDYLPTLIHEFNHSFINYLLNEHQFPQHVEAFREIGSRLMSTSQWTMQRQAYGKWDSVVNESLVRAAVVCYMKEHHYPAETIVLEVKDQVQRNFRWMPQLVALLDTYCRQRDTYPTLESFYPEIIRFFDHYTTQEEQSIRAAAGSE